MFSCWIADVKDCVRYPCILHNAGYNSICRRNCLLSHDQCRNQWEKGMLEMHNFPTPSDSYSHGSSDESKSPHPLRNHIISNLATAGAPRTTQPVVLSFLHPACCLIGNYGYSKNPSQWGLHVHLNDVGGLRWNKQGQRPSAFYLGPTTKLGCTCRASTARGSCFYPTVFIYWFSEQIWNMQRNLTSWPQWEKHFSSGRNKISPTSPSPTQNVIIVR